MLYLLNSKSFTGKTTYLKKLAIDNPQKKVKYFTDEEWSDFIVSTFQTVSSMKEFNTLVKLSFGECDIVCIDNIDFLKGSPTIQEITAEIIADLKDKADFYLSGISLDIRIATIIAFLKEKQVIIKQLEVSNN